VLGGLWTTTLASCGQKTNIQIKIERVQIKLHGSYSPSQRLSTHQGHNCQVFDVIEISEITLSGCMIRVFGIWNLKQLLLTVAVFQSMWSRSPVPEHSLPRPVKWLNSAGRFWTQVVPFVPPGLNPYEEWTRGTSVRDWTPDRRQEMQRHMYRIK